MRFVLDTNGIVAAMRSPSGASAALLRLARHRTVTLVANVALALEYEAICLSDEHVKQSGLTRRDAEAFVDVVIALCEPVDTHFMWRPQLRDPGDEFVLEAAINGQADAIVTFNLRDFLPAARSFGMKLYLPRDALETLNHEKS